MIRRLTGFRLLLLVISIFAIPALACDFSFSLGNFSDSSPKSGFIKEVTMAQGVRGDLRDPVNPTIVFQPNSIFHAVVAIQNAPANTKFKAVWYATDIGDPAEANKLIDATELTTDGTRNIDFNLTPTTKWPPGKYRVEISVNGVLDRVVDFSVK